MAEVDLLWILQASELCSIHRHLGPWSFHCQLGELGCSFHDISISVSAVSCHYFQVSPCHCRYFSWLSPQLPWVFRVWNPARRYQASAPPSWASPSSSVDLWPHMPRRPSRFPDAGHGLCMALFFVPPVVRNGENDDSFWGLWHFGNAESWFGEIWKTAHRLTGHSPQSQFPFKQPSNLNDHWSPFSVTIFILAPYSWSILIMKSQLQWRLTHQNSPRFMKVHPAAGVVAVAAFVALFKAISSWLGQRCCDVSVQRRSCGKFTEQIGDYVYIHYIMRIYIIYII